VIEFYYHTTPNSMKVALLLEELGLSYKIIPIDIFKGEQHSDGFLKINPNGKVPAVVDDGVVVFDSHAILLYLARKHDMFMPTDAAEYATMLSWLQMIATGLSPFSGQAIHFMHYAPEQIPYATNRYLREVERHYAVLDARLATTPFLSGDMYTIADMAAWGWLNSAGYILGEKGLADYTHLTRFMANIAQRPAHARVMALRQKYAFKADLDTVTRKAMFPQNEPVTG
jgi:GSH-dependent disulfide-bond oxidoreductase